MWRFLLNILRPGKRFAWLLSCRQKSASAELSVNQPLNSSFRNHVLVSRLCAGSWSSLVSGGNKDKNRPSQAAGDNLADLRMKSHFYHWLETGFVVEAALTARDPRIKINVRALYSDKRRARVLRWSVKEYLFSLFHGIKVPCRGEFMFFRCYI